MSISVFDLFRIGIGPSSSHTVGPMRAALLFVQGLERDALLSTVNSVRTELYGSLGATGKGHGTDKGVMLGLSGYAPDRIAAEAIPALVAQIRADKVIMLDARQAVHFEEKEHILFNRREAMPEHPNGMKFTAFNVAGETLREARYLSLGGGFVVSVQKGDDAAVAMNGTFAWPFTSGVDLLALCRNSGRSIAQLMRDNERLYRSDAEIDAQLDALWSVMEDCIRRGCANEGVLPGPFKVKRRAPALYRALQASTACATADPLLAMDWVNLFAIAVNEENAAGGRVVTAPTNGAAGIIPAVLQYYLRFVAQANAQGVRDFYLTAAAIGILYKRNASISGAEVGCQGEVGVACSMAAAGLAAVMGGTPEQVENAAEIGMEHNLGLTCDPVGGMVQIPCIERNAMGSIKAINAARIALQGDGTHHVSLDSVIKTMRETGADMKTKYKETSRGGLAVNITEC